MSNTTKILLAVAVLTSIAVVYSNFGVEPQLYLWSWFGYKFGLALTTKSILLKILLAILIASLVYINRDKKKELA